MKTRIPFRMPGQPMLSATCLVLCMNVCAFFVPVNLLTYFASTAISTSDLIAYSLEVWLALLAMVFGTLIIVITIAAESTPKLIDLFVADYRSRFFIWIITLMALENIYIQLARNTTRFHDNQVLLTNYVLLPLFMLLAIPYIFYILKYTKSANVIGKIFNDNLAAIKSVATLSYTKSQISKNHLKLMETINQMHDLLQYVQFKEPKCDIIGKFGISLRYYLDQKKQFHRDYYILSEAIKTDISFRTLMEKFPQIENEQTFYEQKVLGIFATVYIKLISEEHFDLASLCGYEMFASGRRAAENGDATAVKVVIVHFNTLLRYGINHGLQAKGVRNAYNTIFHYSQLIQVFIESHEDARIQQCCKHYTFYALLAIKFCPQEPSLIFLADTFAVELKKILVKLNQGNFPHSQQLEVIKMINNIITHENANHMRMHSRIRWTQISLCLYYIRMEELVFRDVILNEIVNGLESKGKTHSKEMIRKDCAAIIEQPEEFWEETDRGNRNIFYTEDKEHIPRFLEIVSQLIDEKAQLPKLAPEEVSPEQLNPTALG